VIRFVVRLLYSFTSLFERTEGDDIFILGGVNFSKTHLREITSFYRTQKCQTKLS